jgi:hypothetical protein
VHVYCHACSQCRAAGNRCHASHWFSSHWLFEWLEARHLISEWLPFATGPIVSAAAQHRGLHQRCTCTLGSCSRLRSFARTYARPEVLLALPAPVLTIYALSHRLPAILTRTSPALLYSYSCQIPCALVVHCPRSCCPNLAARACSRRLATLVVLYISLRSRL